MILVYIGVAINTVAVSAMLVIGFNMVKDRMRRVEG